MFNFSQIQRRHFEITLPVTFKNEDGEEYSKDIEIKIEPCKVKVLKRLINLSKSSEDDIFDIFRKIVNKNKSKFILSTEQIEEYDIDELMAILVAYFEWINEEKEKNPN